MDYLVSRWIKPQVAVVERICAWQRIDQDPIAFFIGLQGTPMASEQLACYQRPHSCELSILVDCSARFRAAKGPTEAN